MCVGCSRGFEIVDLESLDTQGLLDPNDESLEFVRKRENLRPMAIYRIHNEFLLCYDGAILFPYFETESDLASRVCLLRQQEWQTIPKGIHGALGGPTYRLRWVLLLRLFTI